jgi:quinol monooxygenase YgiN
LDFPAEMPRERQIASATDGRPCWFGAHRSIQTKRRVMLSITNWGRMHCQLRRRETMTSTSSNQGFVITAFWETKPGEEDSVAALLRQFLPEARKEEGVKEFQIHQSVTKPQEFFFYEVFAAETAFATHQQTEHFKKFILGEAIPKLARRERSQFQFI